MEIQTTANSMKTEHVESPCKIGTFPVDRIYMGLVGIQATKDKFSLSIEQFYISGEWNIGHA